MTSPDPSPLSAERMAELLPCPFCGGEVEQHDTNRFHCAGGPKGLCHGFTTFAHCSSKTHAARLWNARTLSAERMAELRELLAKATDGPWRAEAEYEGFDPTYVHAHGCPIADCNDGGTKSEAVANAALIAFLRNHAKSLLASSPTLPDVAGAGEPITDGALRDLVYEIRGHSYQGQSWSFDLHAEHAITKLRGLFTTAHLSGIREGREEKTEKLPDGYEMFEGKLLKVINGDRTGWWRFHNHYDRHGYCDNPERGY